MTRDQLQAELKKTILGLNINPKNLQLWIRKSELYELLGQPDESVETLIALAKNLADKALISQVYEMAVEVCSRHTLKILGDLCSKEFLKYNPESAKALFFRGKFLYERQRSYQAIPFLEKAVALAPENKACLSFLAKSHSRLGMSNAAAPLFADCVDYDHVYGQTYNQLMGTIFSEEEIRDGHIRASKEGVQLMKLKPLPDAPSVSKSKPRIGFVSADLYAHSVGFYFQAIVEGELGDHFDIYAYSSGKKKNEDEMTSSLKKRCSVWREVREMSMQQLAVQIHEDALDILVDLSGFTEGNRLQLFSLKPAPVQLHHIGYPHTTGMVGVDYRIVDSYTDPVGLTEEFTTETLIRMKDCFLCYTPYKNAPDVSPLPSASGKGVCFGSFNNFAKLNEVVLETWAKILSEVANSTLFIKSGPLVDEEFREYLYNFFEDRNVAKDRISLLAWTESRQDHLGLYERVDVHLDSFPYNGTTTTCEAAWQGVPTVTFKGDSHRSRVGYSLMENMGLADYVADDLKGYVELAVAKATDVEALAETRRTLRGKMQISPLMNPEAYSAELTEIYMGLLSKKNALEGTA